MYIPQGEFYVMFLYCGEDVPMSPITDESDHSEDFKEHRTDELI